MEEIDLVSKDTVKELIQQKFESALPKCQDDDDPFIKGEFDVIKELLEKFPSTVEGKKKIDRVLDICGPTPKGTGMQNLRECVIETNENMMLHPKISKSLGIRLYGTVLLSDLLCNLLSRRRSRRVQSLLQLVDG